MKCTGRFKVGPGAATLVLESEWIKKWASSYHPVYVVLVKVPSVVAIGSTVRRQKRSTERWRSASGLTRLCAAIQWSSLGPTSAKSSA